MLSTLKASIQVLVLIATTQAPSAQPVKRASISSHSHLPSNRLVLEDGSLMPWRKAPCQPRWHQAMKHFLNSKFNVTACIIITLFKIITHLRIRTSAFTALISLRHLDYLLDNLIGSTKCLAEFEVCRLYLPDRFPAHYTGSDICTEWGLGTRLYIPSLEAKAPHYKEIWSDVPWIWAFGHMTSTLVISG